MGQYANVVGGPARATAVCESPIKRTQVDTACERLFETLSNLDLTVTELDKKLQRVMRCEPAVPCKSEAAAVSSYNTPIATDIQAATDKVYDSCSRLQRILDLLEV